MKNDIKTGLHLKEGKFKRLEFIKLFEKAPTLGIMAVGDRIIIEERLTVSPSTLSFSTISENLSEDDRFRAIAALNPKRSYWIASSTNDSFPVGLEVSLDWARAMDMIRIDGRTGTPNLIEAAAAAVSLSFADRQTLAKMKDITVYEYLAVWPASIVCIFTVNDEVGASGVGELKVDALKSKVIKPTKHDIILPGR